MQQEIALHEALAREAQEAARTTEAARRAAEVVAAEEALAARAEALPVAAVVADGTLSNRESPITSGREDSESTSDEGGRSTSSDQMAPASLAGGSVTTGDGSELTCLHSHTHLLLFFRVSQLSANASTHKHKPDL